jgi:hypothetical protein
MLVYTVGPFAASTPLTQSSVAAHWGCAPRPQSGSSRLTSATARPPAARTSCVTIPHHTPHAHSRRRSDRPWHLLVARPPKNHSCCQRPCQPHPALPAARQAASQEGRPLQKKASPLASSSATRPDRPSMATRPVHSSVLPLKSDRYWYTPSPPLSASEVAVLCSSASDTPAAVGGREGRGGGVRGRGRGGTGAAPRAAGRRDARRAAAVRRLRPCCCCCCCCSRCCCRTPAGRRAPPCAAPHQR